MGRATETGAMQARCLPMRHVSGGQGAISRQRLRHDRQNRDRFARMRSPAAVNPAAPRPSGETAGLDGTRVTRRKLPNGKVRQASRRARSQLLYPTIGTARCCARAANGHAAAPPRSVMNSRRRMRCPFKICLINSSDHRWRLSSTVTSKSALGLGRVKTPFLWKGGEKQDRLGLKLRSQPLAA